MKILSIGNYQMQVQKQNSSKKNQYMNFGMNSRIRVGKYGICETLRPADLATIATGYVERFKVDGFDAEPLRKLIEKALRENGLNTSNEAVILDTGSRKEFMRSLNVIWGKLKKENSITEIIESQKNEGNGVDALIKTFSEEAGSTFDGALAKLNDYNAQIEESINLLSEKLRGPRKLFNDFFEGGNEYKQGVENLPTKRGVNRNKSVN